MLAEPFIDHVLNDESLTDGIADAEAKVLLTWVLEELESGVATAESEPVAWDLTRKLASRARLISKVTDKLCYTKDLEAANRLWAAAGHSKPLDGIAKFGPERVVRELISLEKDSHGETKSTKGQ